jgi:hypothetical protein
MRINSFHRGSFLDQAYLYFGIRGGFYFSVLYCNAQDFIIENRIRFTFVFSSPLNYPMSVKFLESVSAL